jgi:hypothetical protein
VLDEPPYISRNEYPGHAAVTANQVEVARLQPGEDEGEWKLSPAGPVTFNPVTIEAEDQDEALEKAEAWVSDFARIQPDQFDW